MGKIKTEELFKLYASLNSDYIRLRTNEIEFNSSIAEEQERRLNKIWEVILQKITNDSTNN